MIELLFMIKLSAWAFEKLYDRNLLLIFNCYFLNPHSMGI